MLPFGFAVETDEETTNKLRGLPGVLKVLPDYAFDIKKNSSVLKVAPAYIGVRCCQYGLAKESDSEDWLISTEELTDASIQQRINYCTQTLENAIQREEAEMKIYRIRCESHFLSFGIEIDVGTSNKSKGMPGVVEVLPDYNVTSVPQLCPLRLNDRLTDIFSYHHVSECNPEVNFNHWLIQVKQPCDGFGTEKETIEFCVRILAEVLGSSEEDARKKIYIVWCKMPFGFGTEIEEATSNKLKGLPNVLIVLPDHAFNTKNWSGEVVVISPIDHESVRWSYIKYGLLMCSQSAMATTENSEDIEIEQNSYAAGVDSDGQEDYQN